MLSVCIITKNEEQNIRRCLECLKSTGFEIVVVDTGSTDSTRKIALEYTDKVYDFLWRDDFSAARNFAVSKAEQPYVIMIDSDEFLEDLDVSQLEECIKANPQKVGRVHLKNILTKKGVREEKTEWLSRIFPKEQYYYTGRIHEQITSRDGRMYTTYETPVELLHTGYDLTPEERRKKTNRNIGMLEKELRLLENEGKKEEISEQIPYILYQLGKSYYMAKDYEQACDYFSKGLSYDLNPKLEYVIDMVETYGYALLNSGQAENALFFENIYEEFGDSADFQFLMGLIYMNNARFEEAVEEFLKATTHQECKSTGVNSYAAYYNIGVIYECLGKLEQAKEYYQKCGDYEPAVERLNY